MAVAIERHTNRRTLVVFYAAGLRAGSARLVRGSSRWMTTMRSRPAYIRVINRRRSRSTVTAVACLGIGGHTKIAQTGFDRSFHIRRPMFYPTELLAPAVCAEQSITGTGRGRQWWR